MNKVVIQLYEKKITFTGMKTMREKENIHTKQIRALWIMFCSSFN